MRYLELSASRGHGALQGLRGGGNGGVVCDGDRVSVPQDETCSGDWWVAQPV